KEGFGVAANVLKNLDVELTKVRREVEKLIPGPVGTMSGKCGKLPQTPRAKNVIFYAVEGARHLGHDHVGTEHLRLGILRETEGLGAQILLNLGLDLKEVRQKLTHIVNNHPNSHECGRACIGRFKYFARQIYNWVEIQESIQVFGSGIVVTILGAVVA